jgi:hypothetical protein
VAPELNVKSDVTLDNFILGRAVLKLQVDGDPPMKFGAHVVQPVLRMFEQLLGAQVI